MVECITGLVLLSYFYPSKLKGKALWVALLAGGLALAVPQMPNAVKRVVLRGDMERMTLLEQVLVTRTEVWEAAWEGFKKRPALGWGFGADDTISKQWVPEPTATGVVSRDSVNDILIVLESTGVVGLIAYILLVLLSLKQIPTRRERLVLRRMHSPPPVAKEVDFSVYHNHAIAFTAAAALFVTFQFDSTALSAGNFLSVALWLCVAIAGVIKNKAVAHESLVARQQGLARRTYGQLLRDSRIFSRAEWSRRA